LPHVNSQDEIIRGYFIPKGTVIHQNTRQVLILWGTRFLTIYSRMMLNDPKVWGDPEVFRPERFLEPDAAQRPNPLVTLFGWGMRYVIYSTMLFESIAKNPCPAADSFRVCPGMYFADRVVFHLVATVTSLYKMEPLEGKKRLDPNTVEYEPKMIQYESILLGHSLRAHFIPYRSPIGFECQFVLRDQKARDLLSTISLGE
jgi:cytochrome P450